MQTRMAWAQQDPLLQAYHDNEWGRPLHDDRALFELLSLEGFQAGLNWLMVLKKRAAIKAAFYDFDIARVARMGDADLARLQADPNLIRNRQKLHAVVANAQAILRVQQEFGSLDQYLWAFVGGRPIVNHPQTEVDIPTQTPLSVRVAKDMKQRGFKFVGPVIIYSYFEGAGLIDDHLMGWQIPKDGRDAQ
ncbi:DNA-3-methyladenine glycosylase I [Lacticaseibacillus sp. GG6-2]